MIKKVGVAYTVKEIPKKFIKDSMTCLFWKLNKQSSINLQVIKVDVPTYRKKNIIKYFNRQIGMGNDVGSIIFAKCYIVREIRT